MKRQDIKVLGIDFDGTIVEENYPKIGELREDARYYINKLYDEGFKIIINTCRSGRFADDARDFLIKNGIKYHTFNENLPEILKMYNTDCRKISADLYIDDRNLGGLPDTWEEIYSLIIKKFDK